MTPDESPVVEDLSNNRYLLLVARLIVGRDGELTRGELIDAEGRVVGRFREEDEVGGLVARWLASREHGAESS